MSLSKKLVALLLSLCLLLGMPLSINVSATGTPNEGSSNYQQTPMQLCQALVVPDHWSDQLPSDQTLSLYFNGEVEIDLQNTRCVVTLVDANRFTSDTVPIDGATGVLALWSASLSKSSVFGDGNNNYIVTLTPDGIKGYTDSNNDTFCCDTFSKIIGATNGTALKAVVRLIDLTNSTTNQSLDNISENGTPLTTNQTCNEWGQVFESSSDNNRDCIDIVINTVSTAPAIQYVTYAPSTGTLSVATNTSLYFYYRGQNDTPAHFRVVNELGQVIFTNGTQFLTEKDALSAPQVVQEGYYPLGSPSTYWRDMKGLNAETIFNGASVTVSTEQQNRYRECVSAAATLNASHDGHTYRVALVIDENDESMYASPGENDLFLDPGLGEAANNHYVDGLFSASYAPLTATHSDKSLGIPDRVIATVITESYYPTSESIVSPHDFYLKRADILTATSADRVILEFSKPIASYTFTDQSIGLYNADGEIVTHNNTTVQWKISSLSHYNESRTKWIGDLSSTFDQNTYTGIRQWLIDNGYASGTLENFSLKTGYRLVFAITDSGTGAAVDDHAINGLTGFDGSLLFANDSRTGKVERACVPITFGGETLAIEKVDVVANDYILIHFNQPVTFSSSDFFHGLALVDSSNTLVWYDNADGDHYDTADTADVDDRDMQAAFTMEYFGNNKDILLCRFGGNTYHWLLDHQTRAASLGQNYQIKVRMNDVPAHLIAKGIESTNFYLDCIVGNTGPYAKLPGTGYTWTFSHASVEPHNTNDLLVELTNAVFTDYDQVTLTFSHPILSLNPDCITMVSQYGSTPYSAISAAVDGNTAVVDFDCDLDTIPDGLGIRITDPAAQAGIITSAAVNCGEGAFLFADETPNSLWRQGSIGTAIAAAACDGINYQLFDDAWAAIKPGSTVTLYKDLDRSDQYVFIVPSAVTVDLNGYTLRVQNLISFSDLTDSSDGNGLLACGTDAFVNLLSFNSNLAIYDSSRQGYRFFHYHVMNRGVREVLDSDGNITAVKSGISPYFDNKDAYTLLANGADTLSLYTRLTVQTSQSGFTFDYYFKPATLKTLGRSMINGTGNTIVLTVSGLQNNITDIRFSPALTSAVGNERIAVASVYSKQIDAADRAEQWIKARMENNDLVSLYYDVPTTPTIDPAPVDLSSWTKTTVENDDGWTLTYTSSGTVLTVDILFFPEHAALEWSANITHNGSGWSNKFSRIRILNASFAIEDPIMTTAVQGGEKDIYDYQPYSVDLTETSHTMQNTGGRSSEDAWPYFDITAADDSHGIIGAIGWTGNWLCSFVQAADGVTVEAGLQSMNFNMKSGESFDLPTMVIQFFDGDQDAGHNAWRKLILDRYTPTQIGSTEKVQYAPVTINTWGGAGSAALIERMESFAKTDQYFEYQWIDAGWYGDYESSSVYTSEWHKQVGNWYFNPAYPDGFDSIRQWHDQNGTDFLIWIEPGRATQSKWERTVNGEIEVIETTAKLLAEHPDYFLPSDGVYTYTSQAGNELYTDDRYLDFGNPDALACITDTVINLLDDMGCNFYRQDYNFNPDISWQAKDTQEEDALGTFDKLLYTRTGVAELKYVAGHYAFLDAILATGRQIDNCAGGGRQLDINMVKRSIPLWRSDYPNESNCIASGIRSQGANLSWWLPISGGSASREGINTEYGFRSMMGSGATVWVNLDPDFSDKMFSELLYNRSMMLGDYYILQQGLYISETEDYTDVTNAAFEFYLPEEGRGYIAAFRPGQSTEDTTTFYLKGLEPRALYKVEDADTHEVYSCTGEQLMTDGITLTFPRFA